MSSLQSNKKLTTLPKNTCIYYKMKKQTLIETLNTVSPILYRGRHCKHMKRIQRTRRLRTTICKSYKVLSHVKFLHTTLSAVESYVVITYTTIFGAVKSYVVTT